MVVARYNLHEESNGNGLKLTGLAATLNMVIGSTTFPHKNVHLATWRTSNGKTENQIDHILIEARHKTNMMDVRSYRGANIDSGHNLVVTRTRAKINIKYCRSKTKFPTYNISSLQKQEIKKEYEERMQACSELDEKEIDSRDLTCEEIMNKTAHEKAGKQRMIGGEGWFCQECAEITDKRNKAYKMMVQRWFTRAVREEYREARREKKRMHKREKEGVL
jgi:hypothetical protein